MDTQDFELYLIRRGLSTVTISNYRVAMDAYFRRHHSFNETSVSDFLLDKVKSISHSGYNKYIKAFKQYCAFLQVPVFKNVFKLKEQPKARVLMTDTEIEAFLLVDPPPSKYGVFWSILSFTGARPGEIVGLKLENIDETNNLIYIHKTKTGKPRALPIVKALQIVLYPYIQSITSELLFPNAYFPSRPISHSAYMRNFEWRLEKLGIKKSVKPYSLRHSYATNMAYAGVQLLPLMSLLGQTDPNVTKQYYHENIELMKKAAARLPLAQRHEDPSTLVTQMSELIDEFLGSSSRYDPVELLEAKKHLYKSIKGAAKASEDSKK